LEKAEITERLTLGVLSRSYKVCTEAKADVDKQ